MGVFHQIDPAKFIVSIGSIPTPITGYAKGSMIELSRDANAFEKFVGSDGEVTRVHNRNKAGSMKITLQQGSQSNAALSAWAIADDVTGGGAVPVLFSDMSGALPLNTQAASTYGWVRKLPDAKLSGDTEEPREWIIDLASMPFFVGGN